MCSRSTISDIKYNRIEEGITNIRYWELILTSSYRNEINDKDSRLIARYSGYPFWWCYSAIAHAHIGNATRQSFIIITGVKWPELWRDRAMEIHTTRVLRYIHITMNERRRKRGEYERVGETLFVGLLGKQIIIFRVRS